MKCMFFVFSLLTLQLAGAVKFFRARCPQNVTGLKDFDMEKFKGKWYIHSKYPPIPEKVARCQSVDFKQIGTKLYVEKRKLSSQTDTVVFRKAQIKHVDVAAGSYVQDTKIKVFPEGIQIYILDTDYENFAIRFMCFETNKVISFHWAVLQFRQRVPNAEVVYDAQKAARDKGIKIGNFEKIQQLACPPDT
ncbi:insecticyanin-B isoform X3 [Drosophila kikkawai]|uniref:Insecticyanin-B isoform X3 n=1 Tax=Drosophila kikkawai TaxID=30033 RepID=A0A6P4IGM5_DROKI|nr:insecticyanin-B isoform X1 [Drosophila kikkawai]